MDVSEIERLVAILGKSDISTFELEGDGWRLSLTRSLPEKVVFRGGSGVEASSSAATNAQSHHTEVLRDDFVKVESPIVGSFYRRPSPDSAPFVTEGDVVRKGQTICIIEAMKLMNEIPSPCDGRIHSIKLSDGQVVEFGEVMFLLEPLA
jgi:acetyl-CoA carboxylase biotin carboxyl carrier protein